MKVRELLTDESKWTKGWNARTTDYSPVTYDHHDASCWCLLGAIYKCHCYPPPILSLIRKELEINPQWSNTDITSWNDSEDRTFEEVKELVEKLDI